jgi:hypothetical protein
MTHWNISHNTTLYVHRPVFNELSYDSTHSTHSVMSTRVVLGVNSLQVDRILNKEMRIRKSNSKS